MYGYLGNATWKENEQLYNVWKSMLRRCNCETHIRHESYKNVSVCERWYCFEFFINDVPLIKGWNKEKFELHHLQLDKDYLQKDKTDKIYSLSTCVWIDKYDNNKFQPNHCKKFIMTDKDNKTYTYYSQHECARDFDLSVSLINKCLKGTRKTHNGCTFNYCH